MLSSYTSILYPPLRCPVLSGCTQVGMELDVGEGGDEHDMFHVRFCTLLYNAAPNCTLLYLIARYFTMLR